MLSMSERNSKKGGENLHCVSGTTSSQYEYEHLYCISVLKYPHLYRKNEILVNFT